MNARLQMLLIQLLESETGTIRPSIQDGSVLIDDLNTLAEWRLARPAKIPEYIICPECFDAQAKVDSIEQITCPECGPQSIPEIQLRGREIWTDRVLNSMKLALTDSSHPHSVMVANHLWKIGQLSERQKISTIYFGRRLNDPDVANLAMDKIRLSSSIHDCILITSTQPTLLLHHELGNLRPLHLSDVMLLDGKGRLVFDFERLGATSIVSIAEAIPPDLTSLRYLESTGVVYINGNRIDNLSPQEKDLLIVLLRHPDHELGKDALRDAVGSQAQKFKPRETFKHHLDVYAHFIEYLSADRVYHLKIPDTDTTLF